MPGRLPDYYHLVAVGKGANNGLSKVPKRRNDNRCYHPYLEQVEMLKLRVELVAKEIVH